MIYSNQDISKYNIYLYVYFKDTIIDFNNSGVIQIHLFLYSYSTIHDFI